MINPSIRKDFRITIIENKNNDGYGEQKKWLINCTNMAFSNAYAKFLIFSRRAIEIWPWQ